MVVGSLVMSRLQSRVGGFKVGNSCVDGHASRVGDFLGDPEGGGLFHRNQTDAC
jgi:hypothetical protein